MKAHLSGNPREELPALLAFMQHDELKK